MKRQAKEQIFRGMEQLSLPSEVLGTSHIEIQGDRQILLCGQKGIRSYQSFEIIVEMQCFAVQITGTGLGIVTMTVQELLIRGVIDGIHFLK